MHYHPRTSADTAHTDDFPSHPGIAKTAEKVARARSQALAVGVDESTHVLFMPLCLFLADEFVDRNQQRRIADDPAPPVDQARQFRQRLMAVARAGLDRGAADGPPRPRGPPPLQGT